VKSMPRIGMFIWRKVVKYFHILLAVCKLEWFLGKQIWVDGNIIKCSQGPCRIVQSTVICVQDNFQLAARVRLEPGLENGPEGTLHYNLGEGEPGFWLFGVASLMMYSIGATQWVVSKSFIGLFYPFLYSMDCTMKNHKRVCTVRHILCTAQR